MANTILKGTDTEILLNSDGPTYVIGERINPTGRPLLAEALKRGELEVVEREALKQKEEGASLIDVNVGAPGVDELEVLPRAVKLAAEATGLPVVIDSSNPAAIRAALEVCPGRPLINSITAEKESLEAILPLAVEYQVPVIALCFDQRGILMNSQERVEVARKIYQAALEAGLSGDDLIFDPLVTTVATNSQAARTSLDTAEAIRRELGSNLTMGASNISFGLPMREVLNNSFLALAIYHGVNLPIMNPGRKGAMAAVKSADLLRGCDNYAMNYIRYYRRHMVN